MDTGCNTGTFRSTRINPGVQRALAYIERNFTCPIQLPELAALADLSVCRFVTVFGRQVGLTPHRFICRRRIDLAKLLLREGVPMAQVASEAGFFDQSHLSRHFKSICGITPGRYLREQWPAALAGSCATMAAGPSRPGTPDLSATSRSRHIS